MKKIFVNLGLVISAFVIGLAINNACAQKDDYIGLKGDSEEVGTSTPEYFKVVDGLLIGPDGRVHNRIEKINGVNWLVYFETEDNSLDDGEGIYEYDEYGRIKTFSIIAPHLSGGKLVLSLSYNGLTVRQTAKQFDPESNKWYLDELSIITYRPL